MKKNVLLVILLLTVGVFSAQAGIKFGVKAGVNLANASFDKEVVDPSNFTGFQAGVITEFTLPVLGWGFDAALLYSQQGLKFDKTDLEEEIKLNTLELPVNLKFKLGLLNLLGAYLTTGPNFSFSLSDGWKGLENQYKSESFGFGWNFGLGVEILSHLQVGANYKLGLTDDYKALNINPEAIKGKPRTWSITAAYFF